MKNLPTFDFYCGSNALQFDYGNGFLVWFSYKTPVAFAKDGKRVVRENDWSVTTGKHLNSIDGGDKASRVSGEDFEKMLASAIETARIEAESDSV